MNEAITSRPDELVEEILNGIRSWIEVESPTNVPEAMARMSTKIQTDYEAIGLSVERIPGLNGMGDHLLVTADLQCPSAARGGDGILILSHMDTVHPIGTLNGPLPYRVEGNCAFGPGAEDMKGGTYLALAAIKQILREGSTTSLPIRHLIVSDEEMGSHTSRLHIEREAKRAKYVLVTEPARSGGKIVTARKGCGEFQVTVQGLAAHAGVEHHLGRNAICEIARQVLTIESMTDYNRGLTVSVGIINGGTRSNVVPDRATIQVDVRVPNPQIGEEITKRIYGLKSFDPDCKVEVQGGIDRPGYEKTPEISALFEKAKLIAAEIGFDLQDLKTGGGSDGNFTAAYAPTLDGLGVDGDGGHTLDERLYISSIIPRMQLLKGLMETLK